MHANHHVQFYDDPRFLFDVVADFLAVGGESDGPLLVFATSHHRDGILGALARRDEDGRLAAARATVLDAESTLDRFMVNGLPDRQRFETAFAEILQSTGRRGLGRIRAYGEMVDVLCRVRNVSGATALEGLWNQLVEREPFSLLCSYRISNLRSDGQLLDSLCDLHSRTIPAEHYSKMGEQEDILLRATGALIDPMTALQLRVQSIRARHRPSEAPLERALQKLEAGIRLVNRRAAQVLQVNAIESGKWQLDLEHCELRALVLQAVENATRHAGCELAVRVANRDPIPGVWDASAVREVVENVLAFCGYQETATTIEIDLSATVQAALLTIQFPGSAFSALGVQELLTRETSVELWLARRLVQAHEGTIRALSSPAGGMTVVIELPRSI